MTGPGREPTRTQVRSPTQASKGEGGGLDHDDDGDDDDDVHFRSLFACLQLHTHAHVLFNLLIKSRAANGRHVNLNIQRI